MKFVGARFGYHIHNRAQHIAVLGVVVVRLHLEFLNAVGDRLDGPASAAVVCVDDAVQIEGVGPVARAIAGWPVDGRGGNSDVAAIRAANAVPALRCVHRIDARLQDQQLCSCGR